MLLAGCGGSEGQTPTRIVDDVAALTEAINAGDTRTARALLAELDQDLDAALRLDTIDQDTADQLRTAADRVGQRLAESAVPVRPSPAAVPSRPTAPSPSPATVVSESPQPDPAESEEPKGDKGKPEKPNKDDKDNDSKNGNGQDEDD